MGVEGPYLFLSEPRSQPDDIYYITLNNAYVRELAAPKSVQLLPFTFPLLLLLRQALVTNDKRSCQSFIWRLESVTTDLVVDDHLQAAAGDRRGPCSLEVYMRPHIIPSCGRRPD